MAKFVPRQRKHKAIARQKAQGTSHAPEPTEADSNATLIIPAEKLEREEKRRKLRDELKGAQEGKMSGKKAKRLEKYIDTKLKKEENLVLLKKLAEQKVDTSLYQSSKKLGRTTESAREKLSRALRERQAGIDVEKNEAVILEKRKTRAPEDSGSDSEEDDEDQMEDAEQPQAITTKEIREESQERPVEKPVASFGSGLKRPLEVDEEGKPIIKKRKRTKPKSAIMPVVEEPEWEGFSSGEEDMATDSEDERVPEDDHSETQDESEEESGLSDSSSSSEDEDEEMSSSENEETKASRRERTSAFKAWATQQRHEAIGFTPSSIVTETSTRPISFTPRDPEMDPLPPELESNTATDATRKAFSVHVERPPEIQESRLALPIVAEEQKIMEAIHNNDVVVVWGATGSGKTTQVPQFLFESGYGAPDGPTPGLIGVTQPRRVAAVSMAKRVGDELGEAGSKVSYQIRFDSSASSKTAIKFMTDGVLLREISQDFVLTKYSAIVIDEAHERSVNTDILIGMLSRIVDLRANMARDNPSNKPLKLIIMSATLRISDFTENRRLFRHGPPPLLKAEGRQYSVTNHFARRTQRDYVEEAFEKVSRGHKKLPRGGMLVFLTGQNEITQLAKRLKQAYPSTQGQEAKSAPIRISAADAPLETEDVDLGGKADDYRDEDGSDDESIVDGFDDEDEQEFNIGEESAESTIMKVHVLPLYSQLPTNQQLRVFEPPPDGSRLIVLATNVAETSLTIPGIRYVFDCGRSKEKKYDLLTGVQNFEVGWISKASANQRAGRAGRTGPGHCYRLYSSAVFERDFEEYASPEIMRTPLEGVVLQLKSMGAPVSTFPFPTPPDRDSLRQAEKLLSYLGALSADGKVTKLGHELSLYPLNPRFARMLVMGMTHKLTAETIALVSALSVPELIIPENKLGLREPVQDLDAIRTQQDNIEAAERSALRKSYNAALSQFSKNAKQSDCMKLNNAVCAYAYESNTDAFCDKMFLNAKAMNEASQLRSQLSAIVRTHRPASIGDYKSRLPLPSTEQLELLKQICAAGFIDQVAMRADLAPVPPELSRKPRTAIEVPYVTLFPSHVGRPTTDDPAEQFVYLHPSSLLARVSIPKLPGFMIYSHLQRAAPSTINGTKVPRTRMHPLTPITRPQLVNLALGTPLLGVSKPKGRIVEAHRAKGGQERRECEVEVSLVGEKGGMGWSLGVRRVIQRKEGVQGWVIEKILG
ncbi:DEAH-box RNA helicase-like protein [Mytilinidion resinicola]|uniref:RNA helicase n=1 Tax=Mytilinidion resinicola TaxID=574789 RepID=A0A6A6YRU5_9PEZI|nr:DEAH-box RNA helicase-like protein [Mytilinidion resinicola]KAF2810764.1 DEAH-box RNA helicase-like protein [Mytilinidion resinicola]